MPQMNKGGKFIYGISVVRPDVGVQFPTQAVREYRISNEGKIYLFTGIFHGHKRPALGKGKAF